MKVEELTAGCPVKYEGWYWYIGERAGISGSAGNRSGGALINL